MAGIVVPTPKGDYEFPDQAAADEYLAATKSASASAPDKDLAAIDAAAAERAASEPTVGAYLGNRAKKGLAATMGLPGDLLSRPNYDNLIAETQEKLDRAPSVYMKKYLESRLRELGARKSEKQVNAAGEEGPFIATSQMYKDAMGYDKNMKTSRDELRYAGGVAEMVGAGGPLASVVKNPFQAYALASGSVYGGAGMEAGGDIAPKLGFSREAGEAVGATLGMIGPAVVGQGAQAGVGFLRSRLSPEFAKKKAEVQALQKVSGLASSHGESEVNLARAEELRGRIPGFEPSAAASTGAPGLIALERSLAAQSPENLATAARHVADSAQAIENFVAKTYSGGSLDTPKKIAVLAKKKADALDAALTNLDGELVGLNVAFERNPSLQRREVLETKRDARNVVMQAQKNQRYTAAEEEAARLGVKDDVADIVTFTKKTLAEDFNGFQPENIPSVFREVKSMFTKEAKAGGGRTAKETPTGKKIHSYEEPVAEVSTEVSFDKLMSLRRRVNSDIAETSASSGTDRETKLRLLNGMKSMIEMRVTRYSDPEKYGALGSLLQDAEQFYKTKYRPLFQEGFGFELKMRDPRASGGTALTHEEISNKLLRPEGVRDFRALYNEDPEALVALKGAWLDALHKRAGIFDKNGVVKPTTIDNFVKSNAEAFKQLPKTIQDEIKGLSTDATGLLARRAAITMAQKKLADNKFIQLAQNQDPEKVIGVAISDEKAMRTLAAMAKKDGPLAQEALARRVAEKITEAPDPAAYLNAHRATAMQVFGRMGPEHVRNVEDVVEAISILKRADVPRNVHGAPTMQDPMAEATGSSLRSWIASLMSIERGRTGVLQEGGFVLGRYIAKLTTGHRDAMMQQALYDPHFSKVLADALKSKAPMPERVQVQLAEEFAKIGIRAYTTAGQEN